MEDEKEFEEFEEFMKNTNPKDFKKMLISAIAAKATVVEVVSSIKFYFVLNVICTAAIVKYYLR